ncbi:MAG TPA: Flp family type IVb pilin [Novosphingobium sp.]
MLKRLFLDRTGAVTAEYALILAIVGAAIAGAAFHLATAQASAIESTSDIIAGQETNGG